MATRGEPQFAKAGGHLDRVSHPRVAVVTAFTRRCLWVGALLALLAVALGAFGAHALETRIDARRLASFNTAVQYQFMHAFALIMVGLCAAVTRDGVCLHWAARLLLLGVGLFCGSIYLMTAGAPRWFGIVAPVGGLSFMLAWALLAAHAWQWRS
jgi:uncharacterized membrane protein YgdD (TMEM256/DUF423 family)